MTTVVAVLAEGGVVVGADRQITRGNERVQAAKGFSKLFQPNEDCVVGFAGDVKGLQILRKMQIDPRYTPDEQVDMIYLYMKETFKDHDMFQASDQYGCNLLVAFKDRLFTISHDGCIIEHDDHASIGSGEIYARTALMFSGIASRYNALVLALGAAAFFDVFTGSEFEYILIGEEEPKDVDKRVRKTRGGAKRGRPRGKPKAD